MGTKELSNGKNAAGANKRSRDNLEAGNGNSGALDPRFASAEWDPRFSRVPKKAKKAINDERFQEQLKTNPGFRSSSAPVDRFGRPKRKGPKLDKSLQEIAERSDESSSESEEEITAAVRELPQQVPRYEDSSDDSDIDDELFPQEDEKVEDIPRGRATRRLAVMGLDWSATRAMDIFASLDSFCPPGKRVEFAEIHPSKFGLERLAIEAKLGPQVVPKSDLDVVEEAKKQKLTANGEENRDKGKHDDLASDDEDEEESDDGSEASDEDDRDEEGWKSQTALRKYEEERLMYYYGVVQFEDVKSADAVYEQCDGVEYAQSGRAFDLRFIPDDMVVATKPRDRADKLPEGYAPPNVTPSSLNNSHVKLSWDADDPDRVVLKKKAIGKHQLDEENLKAYLAGSSDEDEAEGEHSATDIEKKRRLLLGAVEEEEKVAEDNDMDMEITFEPGMLEKGEEIVKRKLEREEHKDETPWQARLRRQEERKAEKRRKRKEALASKDTEGNAETADGDADNVDNPTFDSDPFFSMDRDLDDADESRQKRSKKKGKKSGKTTAPDSTETPAEADEAAKKKRQEAELELLMMDERSGSRSGPRSMREMLAAVESDDDEDRSARRERKKTRGRRRGQKERASNAVAEKPSVMDTADARFQQVFDSHLYAMDPTHPKFKRDETTQRILQEKTRRSKKREQQRETDTADGKVEHAKKDEAMQDGQRKKSSSSEAMELVARLKARAAAKRKAKRGAA